MGVIVSKFPYFLYSWRNIALGLFSLIAVYVAFQHVSLPGCQLSRIGHVFQHTTDAPVEHASQYILLASFGGVSATSGAVYLVSRTGSVVHTWETQYQPLYAILTPSGSLFVTMAVPHNAEPHPPHGSTGLIQELDWNSNVVWEYADTQMNHAFTVLPDTTVAYLAWSRVPESFAAQIEEKTTPVASSSTQTEGMWANKIVVVNKNKEKVWEWELTEHITPSAFTHNSFAHLSDWSHINSIQYIENDLQTQKPAFLVSARHIDTIFLIDAESGDVTWTSPPGMFAMQHDATYLSTGTILAYDNGLNRITNPSSLFSRVVEVDPRTNKTVWEFRGVKDSLLAQVQMSSSIMGGAQRLYNGNTLVTSSAGGRIFEVTPEKKIIWELVESSTDSRGENPITFTSRVYDSTDTTWKSQIHRVPALCHLFGSE
jgi:hypothetical protein